MLFILLIAGVAALGYYDGGDITAAVVMAALFGPEVFRTSKRRKGGKRRCQRKIKVQQFARQ